jgi:hypothetical protein
MTKLIVNVETGETVERELTAEELAQQAIDEATQVTAKAEAETKATARAAILDRLGLTAEEAAILLS